MELKTPKKKGFKTPPNYSPLPICHDGSSKIHVDEYGWPIFSGQFIGNSVIVINFNEGISISKKGCFGKGSLSRGCPNTGKRKALLNMITESQWKRRKRWDELLHLTFLEEHIPYLNDEKNLSENEENIQDASEENKMEVDNKTPEKSNATNESNNIQASLDVMSSNIDKKESEDKLKECPPTIVDDDDPETKKIDKSELKPDEVLVISDIENIDEYLLNLNPHIEIENYCTDLEVLHLSLEEAFFLSYALNCLSVSDTLMTLKYYSVEELWVLFQDAQPDFIEKYVAYHYFRAKGWVVKPGIKFGGDFLLYKKGPTFFHASYIVVVETLNPDGSLCNDSKTFTWRRSLAVNRMAETATKELLVCQVMKPDVPSEKFLDLEILKEFKVDEILLRRWRSTSEKEKESP